MKKENLTKESAHALTDRHYWAERRFSEELRPDSSLEPYLANLLPVRSDWTILEIGAVPGNVLLWFVNRFQYKPIGIDFSEDLDSLPHQFSLQGIEGKFIKTNFLTWTPEEQFDVVYSGGFIEHFLNYQNIISRHWDLIRPGGYLILTVPLLSPVQMAIRKLVWNKEQLSKILMSHNLNAMNLDNLYYTVSNLPRSVIVSARPIREMTCWIDPKGPGVKQESRPMFIPIKIFEKVFHVLKWSNEWFSPMLLVVARKDP